MTQRLKGEGALLRNQHGDMKLQLEGARTDATNLAAKAAALQEARPRWHLQRLLRPVSTGLCSTAAAAAATLATATAAVVMEPQQGGGRLQHAGSAGEGQCTHPARQRRLMVRRKWP